MIKHPFRLVVSDIDGTLQNSNHQISDFTIEVIHRLQAKGILVTISTGKLLPAVQEPVQKLNIQIPLILSNGSILQFTDQRMVYASYFDADIVRTIIELVSACEADITVCTPESIYTRKITASVRAMMGFGKPHPREIDSWNLMGWDVERVVKFVIMNMGGPATLAPVAATLKSHLDGRVSYFPTMPYMLEVLPPGEDKASGLRRLADHLKVKLSEIITIGDGDNDIVMHQLAGLSVSVANGTPACKASADVIIDSNDAEGPARFLAGLLKNS
jgi:Cof subfamily protein (haloacid dehalogenase superfamily)